MVERPEALPRALRWRTPVSPARSSGRRGCASDAALGAAQLLTTSAHGRLAFWAATRCWTAFEPDQVSDASRSDVGVESGGQEGAKVCGVVVRGLSVHGGFLSSGRSRATELAPRGRGLRFWGVPT